MKMNEDFIFAASEFEIKAAQEEGGTPSIRIVAYNGGKLRLPNFPHPVVIDTKGVKLHGSADKQPILRNHNQEQPVGHGKPIIGNQLTVEGALSVPGSDRDEIVQAQQNGFAWQASVGGSIPDVRKNVRVHAQGAKVNGQQHTRPVVVVSAFVWKETSFVALGADEDRATAQVAASLQKKGPAMDKAIKDRIEAMGFDPELLSPEQVDNIKAQYEEEVAIAAKLKEFEGNDDDDDDEVDVKLQLRNEHKRLNRIDTIYAKYTNTPLPEKFDLDKLKAQALNEEISPDEMELKVLRASRDTGNTNNTASKSGPKLNALALEAAVYQTAGVWDEPKDVAAALESSGYDAKEVDRAMNESMTSRYRGASISTLIHAACAESGNQIVGQVNDDDLIQAHAWGHQHAETTHLDVHAYAGGFSSVSLPGILGRLANKAMLAAYAEADNGGVATQICSTTSTNDFKKFDRYRMTESGVAELVPPGGEIQHTTVMEESYENQVKTYGSMISLTREMQINDDLNAFLQLPRLLGRQARHSLEQIVISTLVDAPSNAGAGTTEFFHGAIRGNQEPNYLTGAATNLSMDSLELAYELFLNQVDADGKPINIDPSILLCTNGDIVQARKLYNDTEYRFIGSGDRTETIQNQWKGQFRPLKSAYLHRLGGTPSALHWFLMSDPTTDIAGLQIAYLRGQRNPVLSRGEVAFNRLGSAWRVVFDFGVALQDARSIVKVKGES